MLTSGAKGVEERGVGLDVRPAPPATIPTPSKNKSLDVLVGGGAARIGPGERLRGGRIGVDGLVAPCPPLCASLTSVGMAARGEIGSKTIKRRLAG